MAHGEILILQQLLADLIEKGYVVEPADPMSQQALLVVVGPANKNDAKC